MFRLFVLVMVIWVFLLGVIIVLLNIILRLVGKFVKVSVIGFVKFLLIKMLYIVVLGVYKDWNIGLVRVVKL